MAIVPSRTVLLRMLQQQCSSAEVSTHRVRLRTETEGYYYDLVDVTRQALANLFVDLILALNYTYSARSLVQVER